MHLHEVRDIVCSVFGGFEEPRLGVFDCGCLVVVFSDGHVSVKPDSHGVSCVTNPVELRRALEALAERLP